MSGKHGALGAIGDILDFLELLDIFEWPPLILAVLVLVLCVWLLRGGWRLMPRRGAEVVR